MAIRVSRRLRPLVSLAAAAPVIAAAIAVPAIASASPHPHHSGKPSINNVQKKLGALAMSNDQLVEKFNQAQVLVHKRDRAAAAAERSAAAANARYQAAHSEFTQLIQQQYEDTSFGAAGALLDSKSGDNYLDRLNTLDMASNHTAQIVSSVADARTAAQQSEATAKHMLSAATEQRNHVADQRKAVQSQIGKYQDLLSKLNAQQRAAYQAAAGGKAVAPSTLHLTGASNAQAEKAVKFALAQVGKPYVWGSGGPSSFDCSGLTMDSWRHAGISLPHSAAEQYNFGHHVSRSDLEPGDLIFFYQPIGHVTMYIGDGLMVSAPTSGEDVKVVPLNQYTSDYTGATRLVGGH